MKNLLKGKTTKIFNNLRKGVGKHSVAVTFTLVTLGVCGIIYQAQKEIPKAKEEVREIREDKNLKEAQKAKKIVKSVVKNTWKTTVIAIGTILLVTGTSAITAANTAATVANLSNTVNLANKKIEGYESIEKVRKDNMQETVNNDICEDKHWWMDKFTGMKFKATYKQIQAAAEITDLKIQIEDSMMLRDFYVELMDLGVIFEADDFPDYTFNHGWYKSNIRSEIGLKADSYVDTDGNTIWYIEYNDPTTSHEM